MKTLRSRRGTTIAEAIMASAAFTAMLFGVVTMGSTSQRLWADNSAAVIADNDASLALQKLAAEIRTAVRASVNEDGDELSVVMPRLTADGTYDRYQDGPTIRLYVENGVILRVQDTGAPAPLARGVDELRFVADGARVRVLLTARETAGGKWNEVTMAQVVALRNHITNE